MPVVLGLASSHAPNMFAPAEAWPAIHRSLTKGLVQPPEFALETEDVVRGYIARIEKAFGALRDRVAAARLDLLIIIGDDQTEVFTKALNPAVAIFTGTGASGSTSLIWMGQKLEDNHITIRSNAEVGKSILAGLMKHGFDPASVEEVRATGKPAGGLGHAFSRIARMLQTDQTGLPTLPIFVNCYHVPQPSAERCYAFGRALRDVLERRPERIGLYGSGGLSHCPMGPRAGWIDEPLDRWVLERIERGEGEELKSLFTFDSDTLRGGTGEIRAWIAVAGAFHRHKAAIIDYIPARHGVTGLGFAAWDGVPAA
jgi:protocatechuate 4,5-dioxygenase beta chain